MAETLSFSSGSFNLSDQGAKGTEKLDVVEQGNGGFLLENKDGSTIKGLGIQGDNEPLSLAFLSKEGTTLKKATVNLGDFGDTLVISGKTKKSDFETGSGKDSTTWEDIFKNSELDMGAGRDKTKFTEDEGKYALADSSVNMGAGNDRVAIDGGVKDSEINLGTGSDLLIFGGDIKNTSVNLGGDNDKDIIRIAKGAEIEGLQITGAGEGDILFIGSTEYQYNAANDTWVSGDDVIKF